MFAGLVRRATGIRSLLRDGMLVDPIEELPDLLSAELLDGHSAAPFLPFLERRVSTRPEFHGRFARHEGTSVTTVLRVVGIGQAPAPPVLAPMPDPLRPVASRCASCWLSRPVRAATRRRDSDSCPCFGQETIRG